MEFIETPVFTRQIRRLLTDDEYAAVQFILRADPRMGKLIPGGGGLRKVRWRSTGDRRGKRGGIRIIYACIGSQQLYMLDAYAKKKRDDISPEQRVKLKEYLKGLYGRA